MPVIPDASDGLPLGQVVKLKGIAECRIGRRGRVRSSTDRARGTFRPDRRPLRRREGAPYRVVISKWGIAGMCRAGCSSSSKRARPVTGAAKPAFDDTARGAIRGCSPA